MAILTGTPRRGRTAERTLPAGIYQDKEGRYLIYRETRRGRVYYGSAQTLAKAKELKAEADKPVVDRGQTDSEKKLYAMIKYTISEYCSGEEEILLGEKKHCEILDLVLDYIAKDEDDIFPRQIEYVIWAEYANVVEITNLTGNNRKVFRTRVKDLIGLACEEVLGEVRKNG
jgi:hypothetical protein